MSRQAPTGGTKLREGATVDIWVSKGSEKVPPLPAFKGWTATDVDDWLTRTTWWARRRAASRTRSPTGQVYKQDPPAGTEVKRGDTVTYWVSTGKPQATVPDLTNLTQADAETALADAGLKTGTVSQTTSTTVPGRAGDQPGPDRGHEGRQGLDGELRRLHRLAAAESLAVAQSAAGVAVPNVYGMQSTAAASQLSSAGLTSRSARSPTPARNPARWSRSSLTPARSSRRARRCCSSSRRSYDA